MLSIVNVDGDFDNFISIFYNIEQSMMSKVKPEKAVEEAKENGDKVSNLQ